MGLRLPFQLFQIDPVANHLMVIEGTSVLGRGDLDRGLISLEAEGDRPGRRRRRAIVLAPATMELLRKVTRGLAGGQGILSAKKRLWCENQSLAIQVVKPAG